MNKIIILTSLSLILLSVYANSMGPAAEEKESKPNTKQIEKVVTLDDNKAIKMNVYQFGYNPEKIIAKKGQKVKIIGTSDDVPHSIWIKEYGINERVEKGKETLIEFVADKVGVFDIRCRVYCGREHRQMKGQLVIEE